MILNELTWLIEIDWANNHRHYINESIHSTSSLPSMDQIQLADWKWIGCITAMRTEITKRTWIVALIDNDGVYSGDRNDYTGRCGMLIDFFFSCWIDFEAECRSQSLIAYQTINAHLANSNEMQWLLLYWRWQWVFIQLVISSIGSMFAFIER